MSCYHGSHLWFESSTLFHNNDKIKVFHIDQLWNSFFPINYTLNPKVLPDLSHFEYILLIRFHIDLTLNTSIFSD